MQKHLNTITHGHLYAVCTVDAITHCHLYAVCTVDAITHGHLYAVCTVDAITHCHLYAVCTVDAENTSLQNNLLAPKLIVLFVSPSFTYRSG